MASGNFDFAGVAASCLVAGHGAHGLLLRHVIGTAGIGDRLGIALAGGWLALRDLDIYRARDRPRIAGNVDLVFVSSSQVYVIAHFDCRSVCGYVVLDFAGTTAVWARAHGLKRPG